MAMIRAFLCTIQLRNIFLQSPEYVLKNNVFYQRDLGRNNFFENVYVSLREKEGRVYTDEAVKSLPEVPVNHPLRAEWRMRKYSSERLIRHLRKAGKGKQITLLELGCGNGWLCNHLASLPDSQIIGIDINETELQQASRVFKDRRNLCFAYADVLTAVLPYNHFDYIILSASLQYFAQPGLLFEKMFSAMKGNGEIHIVDTPIYREHDLLSARKRSERYFGNAEFPAMNVYYHHHSWQTLESYNPILLYNPESWLNRIKRRFNHASPFPWIKIVAREKKQPEKS